MKSPISGKETHKTNPKTNLSHVLTLLLNGSGLRPIK